MHTHKALATRNLYKRTEVPAINTLLKRVAPGNRKHSVIVVTADSVTPNDTCWNGGTRYNYRACTLDGRNVSHVPAPTAPPQFGGGEARTFEILPGRAVVKLGTFCGKTATPLVFVHPSDAIQLGLRRDYENPDGSLGLKPQLSVTERAVYPELSHNYQDDGCETVCTDCGAVGPTDRQCK